ncbi:hypothetical protein NQZ68_010937 [Dissostichus eleginoides]|nr:hypothetical protein NQZ68_010937 [Dissostichus eleginoides]
MGSCRLDPRRNPVIPPSDNVAPSCWILSAGAFSQAAISSVYKRVCLTLIWVGCGSPGDQGPGTLPSCPLNGNQMGDYIFKHNHESPPTDPSLPPSLNLHHPLPTLLPLGRSDDTAGEHKSFPAQVTFGMFNLREVQMCSSNSFVYGHQDFHWRIL